MKRTGHGAFANLFAYSLEVQTAKREEDQHYADRKSPVSDAIYDEGFLGGVTGASLVEVVADQQVRTQTYSLPTDEHHQVVTTQNQREHREHEQVEIGKEPVETILVVHITGGVHVDEKADSRDDQNHDRGERIQKECPVHRRIARVGLRWCEQLRH